MSRCVLYVRVSTRDQVDNGHSLQMQEQRLRQYAAFKGYDAVELVSDEGLSGASVDRPGFRKVMDLIDRHAVDCVMVYSLSRFARNVVATMDAVELMNRRGVAFVSVTEQVDTTSAAGRFFLLVLAGLGQMEREQVGERTAAILQSRKAQGRVVGSVPFGFRREGDSLVRDELEQRCIHLVQRLNRRGMTCRRIAIELEARGVFNKAGRVRWLPSQVHRILRHADSMQVAA